MFMYIVTKDHYNASMTSASVNISMWRVSRVGCGKKAEDAIDDVQYRFVRMSEARRADGCASRTHLPKDGTLLDDLSTLMIEE